MNISVRHFDDASLSTLKKKKKKKKKKERKKYNEILFTKGAVRNYQNKRIFMLVPISVRYGSRQLPTSELTAGVLRINWNWFGFGSYGKRRHVVWWAVPDVSKDSAAFICSSPSRCPISPVFMNCLMDC